MIQLKLLEVSIFSRFGYELVKMYKYFIHINPHKLKSQKHMFLSGGNSWEERGKDLNYYSNNCNEWSRVSKRFLIVIYIIISIVYTFYNIMKRIHCHGVFF